MNVEQAYNVWANQYDTNHNKTRDLEAISLRETLNPFAFKHCLEIGCGTGKNTEWLVTKAELVTSVDLSDEMLAKAREKVRTDNVQFFKADITEGWSFAQDNYDLVVFSLVLEHIEDLDSIFEKIASILAPTGRVYIGELHPFKQYAGSKARFETEEGQQIVTCFNHHVSDFVQAAQAHSLHIETLSEYFDDNDRTHLPRILTLLFRK
ncbi:MAG: methyltransferase domain-containing protein [Saprospiraceae bacterium]|nr:methyltransferase domain-containing protein [Saprospiraceae bacterium]